MADAVPCRRFSNFTSGWKRWKPFSHSFTSASMKSKRPASAPCPQMEILPETFSAGGLYDEGMLASVAALSVNAASDNSRARIALMSVEHLELLLHRRGRERDVRPVLRQRSLALVGEHVAQELPHTRIEGLAGGAVDGDDDRAAQRIAAVGGARGAGLHEGAA